MKSKTLPYNAYKRELAINRQKDLRKLQTLRKIYKDSKSLSLMRLRFKTIQNLVESHTQRPVHRYHFHKTHPTSNQPNFQYLRHASRQERVVRERAGQFYNLPDQSPVRLIESGRFQSPNQSLYAFDHTVITIETPGGTHDTLHPLRKSRAKRQLEFHENTSLPFDERISHVALSFNHLSRPAGLKKSVNNNQAQGGWSADDLFHHQFDAFKQQLIDAQLCTENELQNYLDEKPHFEHTHLIASHFGRVQQVDPHATESTFLAPAAFNTEMMLFEKFVDFLLYTNHVKHGHPAHEKTVDYTCKVLFAENTTIATGLQLQIKDHHTGMVFTQTWDSPFAVTEKPSMQLYTCLIQALKNGLERSALQGPRV